MGRVRVVHRAPLTALVLVGSVVHVGCERTDRQPVGNGRESDESSVVFRVQLMVNQGGDEGGGEAVIADGMLRVPQDADDHEVFGGSWEIVEVGRGFDVLPKMGAGRLEARRVDGSIYLNLHPRFDDNNVVLSVESFHGEVIRGRWWYYVYVRAVAEGTLELTAER